MMFDIVIDELKELAVTVLAAFVHVDAFVYVDLGRPILRGS